MNTVLRTIVSLLLIHKLKHIGSANIRNLKIKLFLSFFVGFQLNAQVEFSAHFSVKEGLPSSQVYDIIEDNYGHLWFSTDKGLSRFNGMDFQNFDKKDGLPDNVVFNFSKLSNGDIWCTTNSGALFCIRGEHPQFVNYLHNDSIQKYARNLITKSIRFSEDGNVRLAFYYMHGYLEITSDGEVVSKPSNTYFSVHQHHLYVLKDDNQDAFFFDSQLKSNKTVEDRHASLIYEGSEKSEAMFFDEKNTSVFVLKNQVCVNSKVIPFENEVIASGKLGEDAFWIGCLNGGVQSFDLQGNRKLHLLNKRSVTQLYKDRQGNVWASTLERGVFCFKNIAIRTYPNTVGYRIHSLSIGNQGKIFAGCYDGTLLMRSKGGNFAPDSTYQSDYPYSIVYDTVKQVNYFGSQRVFSGTETLLKGAIKYLRLFEQHFLLVGWTDTYLLDVNDRKRKRTLFRNMRITDAVYFNQSVLGGNQHGLWRTAIGEGKEDETNLLPGIRVDALEVMGEILVVGTNSDGIKLMNTAYQTVLELRKEEGLSSNAVSEIFVEKDSVVWVCTNNGVNRILFSKNDPAYTIQTICERDGLLSNEVWDVLIHEDTVWLGTQNGVNAISISDFEKLQESNLDYHLQWVSIIVNDSLKLETNRLGYNQNKLTFRFLGVLLNGGRLTYRYKLNGYSNKWSYTENPEVTFASLDAGEYELIVQAKGRNKRWSDNEIRYAFMIFPPFWKTWWFLLSVLSVFVACIYAFFRLKILVYNKDLVREILRHLLKKLKRRSLHIVVREGKNEVRIHCEHITFVKSSGNYIEIHHNNTKTLVRGTIAMFFNTVPDPIEYIQVRRSYIVRLDKIEKKNKKEIVVDGQKIAIGSTFQKKLENMEL